MCRDYICTPRLVPGPTLFNVIISHVDDGEEGTLGKAADHTRLIHQQVVMPLRGTSPGWTMGLNKMATRVLSNSTVL